MVWLKLPRLSRLLPQWLVGLGVTLLLLQTGSHFAWSSPYLARLTRPDSPLPVDETQASWIASLLNCGRFLGAFLGSTCVYFLGSRRAALLNVLPFLASWILILMARSVPWLYAARVLAGLGVGMGFASFPLYVGEVARPRNRGAILSFAFTGSLFAAAATSLIGKYLSLAECSCWLMIPAILALLIFLGLPDAPHHLIREKRIGEAKEALRWYRGEDEVDKEFDDIMKYVAVSNATSFRERLKELHAPYAKRGLMIVVVLFVFMQCSGLNSLNFYMESVLNMAKFDLLEPYWVVFYANLAGAFVSFLAVVTIDRCGRRVLLVISGLGVALTMSALGTHFLLLNLGIDPRKLQLLPIASVVLFESFYVIGLMEVPSTVMSEILSPDVKTISAFLATVASGVVGFAASKSFMFLVEQCGAPAVFYAHGLLSILIVPFVVFVMPETKGKTLHQIQEILMKKT